ncbi:MULTISPECIES: TetR/AcrR family transcriptional regulator [Aneurinibacillus]|jgi:AcrR family transcriptional regulator|uniref:TetR family transcriptional regulator n=1 Tax=Aneurinibacillus danicus TaxID=267746 RepID=A0A511VAV6_9BACL|nr:MULTISPECIES: TetR/AcrR family transcriptional regulator [Aneurinibacillus]GEN36045.1 TetR family transcriptional regulator [Aneurinibacillus danicus]
MNLRQQKALQTKRKISKVALELFNKKGFSNVTVDEIIEKTGTSKGAFYNHFKSKHDIFLEKFKEIDNFYVDELLPKLDPQESAKEKLKKFFFMQMIYIEKDLGWDVIRTIYENELNTERESFFLIPDRPLYQILYSLCVDGQKKGEFREDLTPEQMVTIFTRMIRGILYDWSINKGEFSLKGEQEALFDVVIRGLMK